MPTWKEINTPKVTHCHLCRFYEPQGTRGGMCRRLQVPVAGNWEACSLAKSPFGCEETTKIKV